MCGGILTVSIENRDYKEIRRIMLEDHEIVLKNGKAAYNGIRSSTHVFNSEADVDRTVVRLGETLADVRS